MFLDSILQAAGAAPQQPEGGPRSARRAAHAGPDVALPRCAALPACSRCSGVCGTVVRPLSGYPHGTCHCTTGKKASKCFLAEKGYSARLFEFKMMLCHDVQGPASGPTAARQSHHRWRRPPSGSGGTRSSPPRRAQRSARRPRCRLSPVSWCRPLSRSTPPGCVACAGTRLTLEVQNMVTSALMTEQRVTLLAASSAGRHGGGCAAGGGRQGA